MKSFSVNTLWPLCLPFVNFVLKVFPFLEVPIGTQSLPLPVLTGEGDADDGFGVFDLAGLGHLQSFC